MQWIRVDQAGSHACGSAGRRIVIRPIITRCTQAAGSEVARHAVAEIEITFVTGA